MKRFLMALVLAAWGRMAAAAPAETEIQAPGPEGPLAGTLVAPNHGPVVLIIPGSGPTDRDGNNPGGIRASPYRLLADGLAARGVTTARIDKRGLFGSAAAARDPNNVTIAAYADDVHSWVKVIRNRTAASCVWLLGHSEGGLVAIVAAGHQQDICGLLLLETAGRPIGEVLRGQLEANPANAKLLGEAMPILDTLEAGKHADTANMSPALRPLFRAPVQGFLISEFSYDPAKLLADYDKPVLILQGERDLQVGVEDARLLQQADPRAKLVMLPGVNHVLKFVGSDDRQANLAAYSNPALPLAPGIVDEICRFVGVLDRGPTHFSASSPSGGGSSGSRLPPPIRQPDRP
jgi:pimeloyl-ACP methyl ester carboxylesterase